MQKHVLDSESPEPLPLRQPYASTMLSSFSRTARWMCDSHGGPLVTMSTTTRRQLGALDINANAPATTDSARFVVMSLLEDIAILGAMLRERGRTAYELPAEALEVLLSFCWGQPTDRDVLVRAIEAGKELETRLTWRMLAMPLVPPGGDLFARGTIERINGWD
jgi:hypothetical protein